jgi:alpha-glucosidase
MAWLPSPEGALVFARGPRFICMVNVSAGPIPLPAGTSVVLASETLQGESLPANTAAWLRRTDRVS